MTTFRTFYQLNDDFTFKSEELGEIKPHLGVLEEPPHVQDGSVAFWDTVLDPIMSLTFGNIGTGEWKVLEDNREKELYRKTNGQKFEFDQHYSGLGPIPEHLTDEPRPTPDHVWKDDAWWIDPATEAAAQEAAIKASVDSKIQSELAKANNAIIPLQDAVELDIATEAEATAYNQWRTYRVLVNRVTTQAGYPLSVEWPVSPD